MDLIKLTQDLIKIKSPSLECQEITEFLESFLKEHSFQTERYESSLIATIGAGPTICFAAHLDVVPEGQTDLWKFPPYGAMIDDGRIYGRGAVDMKGSLACFIHAVSEVISLNLPIRIMILMTNDEELGGEKGAKPLTKYLLDKNEKVDLIIVGEPTNPTAMGQFIKNGRRGILDLDITFFGKAGHTAYGHLADNALKKAIKAISKFPEFLDEGNKDFPPTSIEFCDLNVLDPVRNVIPGQVTVAANIRYNNVRKSSEILELLRKLIEETTSDFEITVRMDHSSFFTQPGWHSDLVIAAIKEVSNKTPEFNTAGGSSDAIFFNLLAPTIEYGLISETIHKVNENVETLALEELSKTYQIVIKKFSEFKN